MTHRKLLQSKAIAIENDLRGTLRNFGLKVGIVGKVKFEARIQELVETFPDLAALVEPLLIVRRALREQIVILHRRLLAIVRDDEMCRHMTRERAQHILRLAGRRRDRAPLALVAEMQERHEHKREGGEGRR
jgi:transposase